MKSLDINNATEPDGILAKFVQMLANVIDCHLSNIITCDISKNKYSEHAKTATVRPIFKKDDKTKIKNYRPVNLLNMFSNEISRITGIRFFQNSFLFIANAIAPIMF